MEYQRRRGPEFACEHMLAHVAHLRACIACRVVLYATIIVPRGSRYPWFCERSVETFCVSFGQLVCQGSMQRRVNRDQQSREIALPFLGHCSMCRLPQKGG